VVVRGGQALSRFAKHFVEGLHIAHIGEVCIPLSLIHKNRLGSMKSLLTNFCQVGRNSEKCRHDVKKNGDDENEEMWIWSPLLHAKLVAFILFFTIFVHTNVLSV
jgi:hypothetical protein